MHLIPQTISEKGGPTTAKTKQLDLWAHSGYICGNEVTIEVFVMVQKLRCGNYVESQYYNPLSSAKNEGRDGLITEDFYAICFSYDNIVLRDEMTKMRDVGGKICFKYAGIVLILY